MTRKEIENYFINSEDYIAKGRDNKRSYYSNGYYTHVIISDNSLYIEADGLIIKAPLDNISWSQKGILNISGALTL